jgi:ribosomal protein L7/L12
VNDYDSERIDHLERKVDYLIRYLGIDPAHIIGGVEPPGPAFAVGLPPGVEVAPQSEVSDAGLGLVYDALRRRKKIEAIKIYRQLTGASLVQAKDAIDAMARDL